MDDPEVIEGFLSGARNAFGPTAHVEGAALFLDGWWQAAIRIGPDVFIVRNEEPPDDSLILDQLGGALSARGLSRVGVDLPAMTPIICVEVTRGGASWTLWAVDLATGEAVLADRAANESFLGVESSGPHPTADFSAGVSGARRLAGLAPSLILTIGVAPELVHQLEESLAECRLVSRTFDEIIPDGCGALMPTMILIDGSDPAGPEFIDGLRADECCRFLPIAAVVGEPAIPMAADVYLDQAEPASSWAESVRRVLP